MRHEFAGLEAPTSLGRMTDELLAANRLRDAFVYWQVTRGKRRAATSHAFCGTPPGG